MPVKVSLPPSFDDLNYLIYMQAQPSAAFLAFNLGNRIAILDGSDLSVVRSEILTEKQSIQSAYTDNTLNSHVLISLRPCGTLSGAVLLLRPRSSTDSSLVTMTQTKLDLEDCDSVISIRIYGGTILMTTNYGPRENPCFYELDITRLQTTNRRSFDQGPFVDFPFAIPLSLRIGLAAISQENSLAIIDFRNNSSAWINQGSRDDEEMQGFLGGIKAASRVFLQGNDGLIHCLDHGKIFSTRMQCNDHSSLFAFSDTSSTICVFDPSDLILRLFDVKREELVAEFKPTCEEIQPLFIDGMPHLVGTDCYGGGDLRLLL